MAEVEDMIEVLAKAFRKTKINLTGVKHASPAIGARSPRTVIPNEYEESALLYFGTSFSSRRA